MKTAVVKSTKDELIKKLQELGQTVFAKEAKVREVNRLHGHLAVQHPKLESMGDDGIFDLCRFARVTLVFIVEAPPIP